jgi:tricorn protease-like protein
MEIIREENINNKAITKTEVETIDEEISIDGKTIMPKEETTLRIMSIEMRTTKRTIVRNLTVHPIIITIIRTATRITIIIIIII